MKRWQADAVVWGLLGGVFLLAFLANAYPRYDTWCLLGAGLSVVSAPAFIVVASWRGWVRGGE